MSSIQSFEVFAVDLPFRKPFKHAAAERATSGSLFIKCRLDSGVSGWGECLSRHYVTGESRDGAYDLLRHKVLPRLIGQKFSSLGEVQQFLGDCDGKAPSDWVPPEVKQISAWSAVDLALLDTFGHEFSETVFPVQGKGASPDLRYSGVASADKGFKFLLTAFKLKAAGLHSVKLKVDHEVGVQAVKTLTNILGKRADIRVDANMAWDKHEALKTMKALAGQGVRSFEQPVAADQIDVLSQLVAETGLGVMVDESFHDRESLETLIKKKACTAVNIRVSKCGGLMASLKRAAEACAAGLEIQVGCQVGESSLLSAAHLVLTSTLDHVEYAEGCFGRLLLKEDPVAPLLQFGFGGTPPARPQTPGLGVRVDEEILKKWTTRQCFVAEPVTSKNF